MTTMIINQVWVTALEAAPPERMDAKVCVMGMSRLLTESEQVADDATWTALLGCCVVVLAPATSGGGAEEEVEGWWIRWGHVLGVHFAAGTVADHYKR